MATGVIFTRGIELVEVRINGSDLNFRTDDYQSFVTIDSLKLSKQGVLKEHPDLADVSNWREVAIQRLKEKVKGMSDEKERINYVIKELKQQGYTPKFLQKSGFRPIKIKEGDYAN